MVDFSASGRDTTPPTPSGDENLRIARGAVERRRDVIARRRPARTLRTLPIVRDVVPADLARELMREVERDELRRLETTNPPRIRPRPATDPGRRR